MPFLSRRIPTKTQKTGTFCKPQHQSTSIIILPRQNQIQQCIDPLIQYNLIDTCINIIYYTFPTLKQWMNHETYMHIQGSVIWSFRIKKKINMYPPDNGQS